MNLRKIMGIAATAMMLLSPVAAFASVNFDTLNGVTFNGKSSLAGVDAVQPGSSIDVRSLINSTGGTDFNSMSIDWVGDFLPPVCVSFPEQTQSGAFFESISATAPTSAGVWDAQLKLYGVNGIGQDFNCNPSNVVDTYNANGRVAVADNTTLVSNNNNTNTGNSAQVGSTAWFQAQIAALSAAIAALAHPATPPAPTASSACADYASLSAGLSQGSDTRQGGRVGQLQSFLMYKGFNIPLLSSNQAPYGYYGSQTAMAASGFVGANHCI